MLIRVLALLFVAPLVAVAVIVAGVVLALRPALGPAVAAIAGCTQWHRKS
jgi:hypothetical protein